jgi:hypothetical protein
VTRLTCPLEIPVEGLLDQAAARAASWPTYRRSMREQAANEVGALGEIVALTYLGHLPVEVVDAGEIGHDLVVDGKTVDVKTKERTVPPKLHYECSVPDYLDGVQVPDLYMFVSLLSVGRGGMERFRRAWVLGTLPHAEFHAMASHWTPDMLDGRNGWRATIPVRNVPISALRGPVMPELEMS